MPQRPQSRRQAPRNLGAVAPRSMTRAPDAVVDTDVIIDHLRGHRRLQAGGVIAYSTVTRCELFSGLDDSAAIRILLDPMVEVEVDRGVAETGGALRRAHGLTVPDALVAATAMGLGVPLITRNTRHFRGVPGLEITAPPP